MPKRISDVSLHVYVTPEALEQLVDTVRTTLTDQVCDRDVYAWRCTLPVEPDDPVHHRFDSRWRSNHPGRDPDDRATYEIALSLVGDPTELTETDVAALENDLTAGVDATCGEVPFTISAHQRTGVDDPIPERI